MANSKTLVKCHIRRHFISVCIFLVRSEKEIQYFLKIITLDTSVYTKDHPSFIVCNIVDAISTEIMVELVHI